jgi:membrane protease YdiL (CAAX protease family)
MSDHELHRTSTTARILIALILAVCGLAIFVLGCPFVRVFPTNKNPYFIAALTVFFLLLTLALTRSDRLQRYWPACYALFAASFATWFLLVGGLDLQKLASGSAQQLALDKISQFIKVVVPLLLLTWVAGQSWGSVFLKMGRLKTGLIAGGVSFVIFAILGVLVGAGSGVNLQAMVYDLPWILIFVFANAFMEELWFRGIFLKRFEPLIGRWPSMVVTAIPFGVSHIMATYVSPSQTLVFGCVVFMLGILEAYFMYKTDSLIGPVLLHAGYDLLIIVPVLATMG